MVVENRIEQVVDMSNYFIYQDFSYGFDWMDNDVYKEIFKRLKSNDFNIQNTINDPIIWNAIGVSVFNMPYIKNDDGLYEFVVPIYSDVVELDVRIQDTIGKIIKKLVVEDENEAKISKHLKFFLYNDGISVNDDSEVVDQNIVQIVFNVITVFMLRFIRQKNSIDEL